MFCGCRDKDVKEYTVTERSGIHYQVVSKLIAHRSCMFLYLEKFRI